MLLFEMLGQSWWRSDVDTQSFRYLTNPRPDDIGKILGSGATMQKEGQTEVSGQG